MQCQEFGSGAATPATIQQTCACRGPIYRRSPTRCCARTPNHIGGVPWFGDWGRDTMIVLPGFAFRPDVPSKRQTFSKRIAHFVSEGMLPNNFPCNRQAPYTTRPTQRFVFQAVRDISTQRTISSCWTTVPVLERDRGRARSRNPLTFTWMRQMDLLICGELVCNYTGGSESRRSSHNAAHWQTGGDHAPVVQRRDVMGICTRYRTRPDRYENLAHAHEPASIAFGIKKKDSASIVIDGPPGIENAMRCCARIKFLQFRYRSLLGSGKATRRCGCVRARTVHLIRPAKPRRAGLSGALCGDMEKERRA